MSTLNLNLLAVNPIIAGDDLDAAATARSQLRGFLNQQIAFEFALEGGCFHLHVVAQDHPDLGENIQPFGLGRRVTVSAVNKDDIVGRLDRSRPLAARPQISLWDGYRSLDLDLWPGGIKLQIGAELNLQIGGFQRLKVLALNRQF